MSPSLCVYELHAHFIMLLITKKLINYQLDIWESHHNHPPILLVDCLITVKWWWTNHGSSPKWDPLIIVDVCLNQCFPIYGNGILNRDLLLIGCTDEAELKRGGTLMIREGLTCEGLTREGLICEVLRLDILSASTSWVLCRAAGPTELMHTRCVVSLQISTLPLCSTKYL